MTKKKHASETPATHFLKQHQIQFEEFIFEHVEKGGTKYTAEKLKVDEHQIIKTLIMEDNQKNPHIVLMHGDCEVSLKKLARQINVKKVEPANPSQATRYSGYLMGGTSPFGTRKKMPVWFEESIFKYEQIYINGGGRGYIILLKPQKAFPLLNAQPVNVAN